jgi:hypothetical protein
MSFLMVDNKHKRHESHNKMLLPSNYFDINLSNVHKSAIVNSNNQKLPFSRDYKMRQRDKNIQPFNHPPPFISPQALAMMEFELENNLVLNNSNSYYKTKVLNADRKR